MSLLLIVDDKEENRYLLESLLTDQGYEVVSAIHGADALEKARENPPDMIIADILMPVMDGFALCRRWKNDDLLKSIPFIFYTATYTDERDRAFALNLGADRFLVKPMDPEDFLKVVQETLEKVPAPSAAQAEPKTKNAEEESEYLKQYNEVLIRKLEAKMEQLEQANKKLERDIDTHKKKSDKNARLKDETEKMVEERTAELKKNNCTARRT
ncbi:MAG TPA: response regulator [Deltaproteobacteria bacterium]|nr:response regulator [Deltaproteobacteria bacterium]